MKTSILASALLLAAGPALADVTQDVIDGLKAEGYTHIEIKQSAARLTVEATKGDKTLEQVIDRTSGAVLKEEVNGVETAESEGQHNGSGSDDASGDDDSSGSGKGSDDGASDDSGDDHGGASGSGSDDGGSHDSGDDHDSGGHDKGGDSEGNDD